MKWGQTCSVEKLLGKIMYYRARTYDPQTGRFMQRDPLGVNPAAGKNKPFIPSMQYEEGANIYEYVYSTPLQDTDPLGTMPLRSGSQHTNVRSHTPKTLEGYIRSSITGPFYKKGVYETMQYLVKFNIGCDGNMAPFITHPYIAKQNRVGDVDYVGIPLGEGIVVGYSWHAGINEDESKATTPREEAGYCRTSQYVIVIDFDVIIGLKFSKHGNAKWDIFHVTEHVGSKSHTLTVRCCCG